jgi:DnaJ homolog subfamily A member 2
MSDDLYDRLGVSRDASVEDIKRSWRRKILTEHPDKGGDKESFQKLQEAYDVLSDPQKKELYDETGHYGNEGGGEHPASNLAEMFHSMFGGGGGRGGGGGGGFPFFQGMMGGMGGMGRRGGNQKEPRGPNKLHEIGISLEDMYHGKTVEINMRKDKLCSECSGKGGTLFESCASCNGSGMKMRRQAMGPIVAMVQEPCDTCNQTGEICTASCDTCAGKKVLECESHLSVTIEPGMKEQDRLVFAGQCSESPLFEAPGDVILVLRELPTSGSIWKRSGDDLRAEVKITVAESLLGWSRTLTNHPSRKVLPLLWSGEHGILQEGDVLHVPGWGMPKRKKARETMEFGKLILTCTIEKQENAWSEEQRRTLQLVFPQWERSAIEKKEESVLVQRS